MRLSSRFLVVTTLLTLFGCKEGDLLIEEEGTDTTVIDTIIDKATGDDDGDSTTQLDATLCESIEAADCSKWEKDEKEPPLVDLKDFGLGNGSIIDVAAVPQMKPLSYEIAVIGTETTDSEKRFFLLVFEASDPLVYSISRLEFENVDRLFGLHGPTGGRRAIACADTCRIVESKATTLAAAPLQIVDDIDPLPDIDPTFLASSSLVVGRDVVRLQSGTWSTLIEGPQGTAFNSAYAVYSDVVFAVGDGGRIVRYLYGDVEEMETGTSDDFVTVWANKFSDDLGAYFGIYALSTQGTAFVTFGRHETAVCPYLQDPVAIFDGGFGAQAVTADGGRHLVSIYDEPARCRFGGFNSAITGTRTFLCGLMGNVVAWNSKEIFAQIEPACAID